MPRPERERQILDAAAAAYGERGYAHVSVADVATRAGISKPLVYEYFGSKEGLFLACLRRAGDKVVEYVEEAQHGADLSRVTGTLAAIFRALEARPDDWAVIHDATLPVDSDVFAAARRYRLALAELAVAGTAEVLEAHGLRDPLDVALVAEIWSSTVLTVVRWWLARPEIPADAMAERCERLLLTVLR